MKKVMFVFGYPGAGVKTFVNQVFNKNETLVDALDLECKNVFYIEPLFKSNDYPSSMNVEKDRLATFDKYISDFLTSDIDVLLIKGDFNDYNENGVCTLRHIAMTFPDLQREIIFLCPSDLDVGYERLKNTAWFQKNPKENAYKFQFDWYRFATAYMRTHLMSYDSFGYKVQEVDTLDGYKFMDHNDVGLRKINPDVKK